MRTPLAALTLAGLGLVGFAPAAEAKLPSPPNGLVVPNKSIAGVKLGMKAEKAVKVWGKGGSCDEVVSSTSCRWDGTMKQGSARFDVVDGKVHSITITAGQKPNADPNYRSGPLLKYKTAKKVGLGSTLQKVARKYKKAKPDGGGLSIVSGGRRTLFASSFGRVQRLTVDLGY
jgi:hypothetical protein